jgi:glutathione S-transferase
MTYTLIIGDRAYSSWSLRGWLLFENFGLKAQLEHVTFSDGTLSEGSSGWAALAAYPPAKTVPALVTPEGAVVDDSLAIAEELATRHPEAGLWPSDPKSRATARTLAAEMHSSFGPLRSDCPMNLRCAYTTYAPSEAVQADIARIETIWAQAFDSFGGDWLCGAYSAADAFYAPVAARIAGYGIAVSARAQAYVDRHLADPAFRRWRAMSLVKGPDLPWYAKDYAQRAWPGPAPLQAEPADGPSGNAACPYSGKPVTDFMRLGGKVYGFCNTFCRDKTVPDPAAWPAFMEIYQS